MDFWQRPLTDFGVLGPDQGKGGKYLFVGPGQEVSQAADTPGKRKAPELGHQFHNPSQLSYPREGSPIFFLFRRCLLFSDQVYKM